MALPAPQPTFDRSASRVDAGSENRVWRWLANKSIPFPARDVNAPFGIRTAIVGAMLAELARSSDVSRDTISRLTA